MIIFLLNLSTALNYAISVDQDTYKVESCNLIRVALKGGTIERFGFKKV